MSITFTTPPSPRHSYARLASRMRQRKPDLPDDPRLPGQRLQLPAQSTDVGHLARYSRVCGFGLSGILPATYLHVLTFPLQLHLLADPAFPLPALGLVHTQNRIVQHRPVDVRERLTLTVWADDLRPHRRGVGFRMCAQAHSDGALVWEGESAYLARGVRLAGSVTTQPPAGDADPQLADPQLADPQLADPRPADPQLADPRPADLQPEGVHVDSVLSGRWRLPADLGRRYAAVSGDVNPIHLSAVAARALGFPRTIAHGMWTHARSLAAMEPLPPEFVADVRFRRPVLLPSSVAVHRGRQDGTQAVEVRSRNDVHARTVVTLGSSVALVT